MPFLRLITESNRIQLPVAAASTFSRNTQASRFASNRSTETLESPFSQEIGSDKKRPSCSSNHGRLKTHVKPAPYQDTSESFNNSRNPRHLSMNLRTEIRHATIRQLRRTPIYSIVRNILGPKIEPTFTSSADYWQRRYSSGGNSGEGSYGKLARYKANFINQLATDLQISSVLELGCGDGNQASLLSLKHYTGVDISEKCIAACKNKFSTREWQFYIARDFFEQQPPPAYDLTMSLDVIYHLVEDDVYEQYLQHLLSHSRKYALIYSSDFTDFDPKVPHIRHRSVSDDILRSYPDWRIKDKFQNPLSKSPRSLDYGSFAFFQLFERATPMV